MRKGAASASPLLHPGPADKATGARAIQPQNDTGDSTPSSTDYPASFGWRSGLDARLRAAGRSGTYDPLWTWQQQGTAHRRPLCETGPMTLPTPTGQGADPEELRGWVCRKLLAEDARWAMDVTLSAFDAERLSGFVPLLMGHHFVRIIYEGAIAIRSSNPNVGIPELAALLEDEYATITARARHLTKLLDNTKRSHDEVLADLASEMKVHHEELTGRAPRLLRGLEKDLGLYDLAGAMIGATIPIAYRLGLHPAHKASISGEDIQAVSEEWGRTLAVLGAATLDTNRPTPTLDFSNIRIDHRDRMASKYLSTRFDPDFPQELRALLLLIEGDLNTARLLLPSTSPGHAGPVFRARLITAYHCLSSLYKICHAYPAQDSAGLRRLRSLLTSQPARELLSPGGTKVRNRCVHYEMNDPTIVPNLAKPMYGLVEAVYPGQTWQSITSSIREVIDRAAKVLAGWTS